MPRCRENYANAAQRHWKDAEILFNADRIANADHLYGLAAECALKALWEPFPGSSEKKNFRVHMDGNKLFDNLVSFLNSRNLNLSLPENPPYDDWAIDQRYCLDTLIKKDRVKLHRDWTRLCVQLPKHSNLNGHL